MFGFRLRIRFWRRREPPVVAPAGWHEGTAGTRPAGEPPPGETARQRTVHVSPGILDQATPVIVDDTDRRVPEDDGGAGATLATAPVSAAETASTPPAIPSLEGLPGEAGTPASEPGGSPRVIRLEPEATDSTTTTAPERVGDRTAGRGVEVKSGPVEADADLVESNVDAVNLELPSVEAAMDSTGREVDLLETEIGSVADIDEEAVIGSGLPLDEKRATAVVCPNCAEPLETKPMSRTACRHCGRIIHVRARQTLFLSGLVGEDDVDAIDFLERIEPFGIDERLCVKRMKERPLAEVLWQLCEDRLDSIPIPRQAHLLNEMAEYLRWQGKDATPLRQRAEGASLLALKEKGIERVRITTRGEAACPVCRDLGGTVLEMDRALQDLPLPVEGCTSRGACRCVYAATPGP